MKPVVAVVGRPNVGKSTLVNRILGRREAIVEEKPGVTRDRASFDASWQGSEFTIVDTGGWERDPASPLESDVRRQTEVAIRSADAVVLVTDVTVGVTEEDDAVARLLRRSGIPVVVAANKADNRALEASAADFWSLGLGPVFAVSALHGRGSGDFLDGIVDVLPEDPGEVAESAEPRVAVVGRPNVGKSTLFNRLAGEERAIVSDAPGTTRDAVDTLATLDGVTYRFVDTAGIRRRTRVDEATEFYATVRARDAIDRADAVLFVLDANDGATAQDQRLAEEIEERGCAVVVLLNKWDLLEPGEEKDKVFERIGDRLHFLSWAPVVRISAKTGNRVQRIPAALELVLENRNRRVPTPRLNEIFAAAQDHHAHPLHGKKSPRVMYATQTGVGPPTFRLFTSGRLDDDYVRYLERALREADDFTGTPVRLVAQARERRRERSA